MKKNVKVISISGIRGLVLALFIVVCLFFGFIVAPVIFCTYLWNWVGENFIMLPKMTFLHGSLLWSIIALSVFATCKGKINIGIASQENSDESEIKSIIEKVKDNTPQLSDIDVKKQVKQEEKEIEKVEK